MDPIPPLPGPETKSPGLVPLKTDDEKRPLSKKMSAFMGFLLFVGSCVLMIVNPLMPLVGFGIAFIFLFVPGYRCIFLGYILTLGVVLLSIIIYCSNNPVRF